MLLQIIYPTYPFSVSRNWIKYNLSLLTFSELVHHMVSRNFQSRIPNFPALLNQSERVLVYCLKKFGKLDANSRTILRIIVLNYSSGNSKFQIRICLLTSFYNIFTNQVYIVIGMTSVLKLDWHNVNFYCWSFNYFGWIFHRPRKIELF